MAPDEAIYDSFDEALVEGSMYIYHYSPKPGEQSPKQVEYTTNIFKDRRSQRYGYTQPYGDQNPKQSTVDPKRIPARSSFEGASHNHPEVNAPNHRFSKKGISATGGSGDIGWADAQGKPIGLVAKNIYTDNVVIKKYTPLSGSASDTRKHTQGTVEEYDPATKRFGPEQQYRPSPPKIEGGNLIGIRKGKWRYEMPDGTIIERNKPLEAKPSTDPSGAPRAIPQNGGSPSPPKKDEKEKGS